MTVYARDAAELAARLVEEAMERTGKAASTLGMDAGLSHNTLYEWLKKKSAPRLNHFLWLLESAGYEFVIRRKGES